MKMYRREFLKRFAVLGAGGGALVALPMAKESTALIWRPEDFTKYEEPLEPKPRGGVTIEIYEERTGKWRDVTHMGQLVPGEPWTFACTSLDGMEFSV